MDSGTKEESVSTPADAARLALFLDVDGTLLDLAPRPEGVVVPASLIGDLRAADRLLGGAVALVSGRTIDDLDRLFRPLRLRAVGVHGAEMRFVPDGPIEHDERDALSEEDWTALQRLLAGFPAAFAEHKRYAFAVHYRDAPHLRQELEAAVVSFAAQRPELVVMPGHCVFELKRAVHDKGSAVARLLERAPFAGRTPVFIGDDTTDEPGFATVLGHQGHAYSVGRHMPGLTDSFSRPAAVRAWLAGLAGKALVES